MIKLMVVGFCSNEIDASPGIGCKIWKENYLQGSEMTPRLHNSGYFHDLPMDINNSMVGIKNHVI